MGKFDISNLSGPNVDIYSDIDSMTPLASQTTTINPIDDAELQRKFMEWYSSRGNPLFNIDFFSKDAGEWRDRLLGGSGSGTDDAHAYLMEFAKALGLVPDSTEGKFDYYTAIKMSDYFTDFLNMYNTNKENMGVVKETNEAKEESTQDAVDSLSTTNESQRLAAANAGVNKSRAGLLGTTNSQQNLNSTYAGNLQGHATQAASTQADYLNKMNQADAAQYQAENMEKGLGWSTAAGALSGLAQGIGFGSGIFSDERLKEDPIDDDKLAEAIEKFKSLYTQLKTLKEAN